MPAGVEEPVEFCFPTPTVGFTEDILKYQRIISKQMLRGAVGA